MKKKPLYTTPEDVRRLLTACWPDEYFSLQGVLASGGQADVYQIQSRNGMEALKIINTGIYPDETTRLDRKERAEQEIFYTTQHSGKPFSVLVYDTGKVQTGPDESFCLCGIRMELLVPLETYLASFRHDRTRYIQQVLYCTAQAAEALEALLQSQTLHRDVKPSNLLLRRTGSEMRVVLSDYGLARPDRLMNSVDAVSASGTDQYISPEILYHRRIIENRSDVFALAVTLFHLVCGSDNRFDPVAYAVDWKQYDAPEEILHAILKMGEADPSKRWSSAQATAELHWLYLKTDSDQYCAEIKALLRAISADAPQAQKLLDALPEEDSVCCLLRAGRALHQGNAALARQELTHGVNRHNAAAAYYLAGLVTSRRSQQRLLQFAAVQGFQPAQDALRHRHRPVSKNRRLNALKAALYL